MKNSGLCHKVTIHLVFSFGAFAMLVAVSSLSIPGLLDEYELVEGDAGRRVFKLAVHVDAKDFTLQANIIPHSRDDNEVCFWLKTIIDGNEVELQIIRQTFYMSETEVICDGVLTLHVSCQIFPTGADDCGKIGRFRITIKITRNV